MSKKPFKETKVGKLLGKVGGMLPESGVLGVLKQVIDTDDSLSQEEREEAHKALIEAYEAEVADRSSARQRQVEMAKAGRKDWLFNITGLVGLGAFGVIIWAILALDIPETNKELFYHLIGIVEGVSLSIFGYYFGTSMKDDNK